uniref:Uncharacterized protein n=1 Tax=Rhipicephalus pulchellus TaxID=72859 RepID=L7LXI8_RHIPC
MSYQWTRVLICWILRVCILNPWQLDNTKGLRATVIGFICTVQHNAAGGNLVVKVFSHCLICKMFFIHLVLGGSSCHHTEVPNAYRGDIKDVLGLMPSVPAPH